MLYGIGQYGVRQRKGYKVCKSFHLLSGNLLRKRIPSQKRSPLHSPICGLILSRPKALVFDSKQGETSRLKLRTQHLSGFSHRSWHIRVRKWMEVTKWTNVPGRHLDYVPHSRLISIPIHLSPERQCNTVTSDHGETQLRRTVTSIITPLYSLPVIVAWTKRRNFHLGIQKLHLFPPQLQWRLHNSRFL